MSTPRTPSFLMLLTLALVSTGCGKTDPSGSSGVCGDAVWDDGEECDAGELNSDTGNCHTDCTLAEDLEYRLAGWVLNEDVIDAEGVDDDTAPLGDGAWSTSSSDVNGDGLIKFELYLPAYDWSEFADAIDPSDPVNIPPDLPAPGAIDEIAVSDILEISFQTRRDTSDSNNFYLVIYTQPTGTVDGGSWYSSRLTALPSQARMSGEMDDTWTKWSTIDGANQLVFADQPEIGSFTGPSLPTLGELTATTTFDWNSVDGTYPSTSIDYGAQMIRYISLQTGSGTSTSDFDGLLDEIIIRTTDGRSITFDLEPRMSGGPGGP